MTYWKFTLERSDVFGSFIKVEKTYNIDNSKSYYTIYIDNNKKIKCTCPEFFAYGEETNSCEHIEMINHTEIFDKLIEYNEYRFQEKETKFKNGDRVNKIGNVEENGIIINCDYKDKKYRVRLRRGVYLCFSENDLEKYIEPEVKNVFTPTTTFVNLSPDYQKYVEWILTNHNRLIQENKSIEQAMIEYKINKP